MAGCAGDVKQWTSTQTRLVWRKRMGKVYRSIQVAPKTPARSQGARCEKCLCGCGGSKSSSSWPFSTSPPATDVCGVADPAYTGFACVDNSIAVQTMAYGPTPCQRRPNLPTGSNVFCHKPSTTSSAPHLNTSQFVHSKSKSQYEVQHLAICKPLSHRACVARVYTSSNTCSGMCT